MGSSSFVPYSLDKYLSRICTYIRRVSVMRVFTYFFHIRDIHGYRMYLQK